MATTIDRRADTYIEKLYGVRGLYAAAGRPTARRYETFLARQAIVDRYPGLLSIAVAERTLLGGRPAFVARRRAEVERQALGYLPFTIRPNAERAESVVVDFVHPVRASRTAVGLDLMSEGARRAAVLRARDSGRPVATAPLTFVTEREGAKGVSVMLGLYDGPDPGADVAARRRRFRGVTYAAIRLPDLLRGIAREGEDLEIYDVGSVGERVPARLRAGDEAFDLAGGPDAIGRDREGTRLRPLNTAGRRWSVYVDPGGRVVSTATVALPWLVGIFGTLVALLAAGIVQAISTSRDRAEALTARRTRELRRSNEELERFAVLASHDLQQPLRTVDGFLQLLDRRIRDELDPTAREYLALALRGTREMTRLIEDLLTYSRVARDDRPPTAVALDDAWDEAVAQLGATIEASGARVTRDRLPVVAGDPGQLVQVFSNLIGNAVKYRGTAAPVVQGRARRAGAMWEITVADNGIGIEPRHHARIFEMFRRLHTEEEFEGTGLGLALVKRIVERSGGDVRVESAPGQGSRFVVSLPAADLAQEAAA